MAPAQFNSVRRRISLEVHPAQAFRFQVLRRTDRAFHRARPHRRGRAQWLRQVQPVRRPALGDGRDPPHLRARQRDGRCDLRRQRRPPGAQRRRSHALHRQCRPQARAAPYNDYDTIEVSRRIEREAGSVYRINGRDVRQRDVQIFFADASSGAGSTAFVRQGQIGLLISQKPLARRAILEEAAGIGGLHQRRHEAELRLRAAETNLSRLEDVIREVEGQLASLKRQARQASRYRNLSGHIRKAEALAHYPALDRGRSARRRRRRGTGRRRRRRRRPPPTSRREASTVQSDAAAALPPLRQAEAERVRRPHRLIVAARAARCRRSARPRGGAAPAPADRPGRQPTSRANRRSTRTRTAALATLSARSEEPGSRRRQRRRRSRRRRSAAPRELHETLAEARTACWKD